MTTRSAAILGLTLILVVVCSRLAWEAWQPAVPGRELVADTQKAAPVHSATQVTLPAPARSNLGEPTTMAGSPAVKGDRVAVVVLEEVESLQVLLARLAACSAPIDHEFDPTQKAWLLAQLLRQSNWNSCQRAFVSGCISFDDLMQMDAATLQSIIDGLGDDLSPMVDLSGTARVAEAVAVLERVLALTWPSPLIAGRAVGFLFSTTSDGTGPRTLVSFCERIQDDDMLVKYSSVPLQCLKAEPDESWIVPAEQGMSKRASVLADGAAILMLRRASSQGHSAAACLALERELSSTIDEIQSRVAQLPRSDSAHFVDLMTAMSDLRVEASLAPRLASLYAHPDAVIRGAAFWGSAKVLAELPPEARADQIATLRQAARGEEDPRAAPLAYRSLRLCDPDAVNFLSSLREGLTNDRLIHELDGVLKGGADPRVRQR